MMIALELTAHFLFILYILDYWWVSSYSFILILGLNCKLSHKITLSFSIKEISEQKNLINYIMQEKVIYSMDDNFHTSDHLYVLERKVYNLRPIKGEDLYVNLLCYLLTHLFSIFPHAFLVFL